MLVETPSLIEALILRFKPCRIWFPVGRYIKHDHVLEYLLSFLINAELQPTRTKE